QCRRAEPTAGSGLSRGTGMSQLTLVAAIAQVVGGTQPTQQQAALGSGVAPPYLTYWYSGRDVGDGSGVSGLVGCFSVPTELLSQMPVAMVIPDRWEPTQPFPTQGEKLRVDRFTVRLFVGNNDMQSLIAQMLNFADTVPSAFDSHMELLGQVGV